jgi:hypothetical protein
MCRGRSYVGLNFVHMCRGRSYVGLNFVLLSMPWEYDVN